MTDTTGGRVLVDLAQLRAECRKILEIAKAFSSLSGMVSLKNIGPNNEQTIKTAGREDLNRYRKKLSDNNAAIRSFLGATKSDETYLRIWDDALRKNYEYIYFPKMHIESLFSNMGRIAPNWNALPAHTLIKRYLKSAKADVIWAIWPEADIYSDIAVLWNLSFDLYAQLKAEFNHQKNREYSALVKALILNAYHFLEAFLNAAALNFWYHNRTRLDSSTLRLLLEWDEKKQQRAHLSLREKLLKYPRIIGGTSEPIFTEAHEDFQFITSIAMRMRHAQSHPSLRPDMAAGGIIDPAPLLEGSNIALAERAVDSAIRIAKEIAQVCYADQRWLYWLQERSAETGRFLTEETPKIFEVL